MGLKSVSSQRSSSLRPFGGLLAERGVIQSKQISEEAVNPWHSKFVTLTIEVTSLEKQLRDLREMPSRSPPRNGMDSVSRGYVYLKEWSPGRWTPACIHHGSMLRVAECAMVSCVRYPVHRGNEP